MKSIFLFPANGIHHSAYRSIFNINSKMEPIIYGPLKNPGIASPLNLDWSHFFSDVNDVVYGNNNVGIGHSLGGTLLLHNAIKYPKQWKKIIIIEPAIFSKKIHWAYKLIRFLKLEYKTHPMIRLTKNRREQFESIENTFKRWRNYPTFKYLSNDNLLDYVKASIVESENTFKLRFPKQWEIEIYRGMCSLDSFIWQNIQNLEAELIVIGAETSNTFMSGARQRLQKHADLFKVIPNTTHLLPFEAPKVIADLIQ